MQERLVGDARVEAPAVGLGVDGHTSDAELAQRPEDPDGDLTAIRDEDLAEGGHGPRILSNVTLPDQLTLARALAVPVVVVLFAWDFDDHAYWATVVFIVADGDRPGRRLARAPPEPDLAVRARCSTRSRTRCS